MCYFGNEIQQDDYGSETAALLEELFRATRILDLERLPKHDPTRSILETGKTGRERRAATDKAKSDIWQQHRPMPYVRMRQYRIRNKLQSEKIVSRERGRERASCRKETLLPLLSLYSLLVR